MKLDDFDYRLPSDLIADEPLPQRDASRMMVLDRGRQRWEHRMFRDLPSFLSGDDLLVFNKSKVVKARLVGRRIDTGGAVEAFVLGPGSTPGVYECLVKLTAARKEGVLFQVAEGVEGRILQPIDDSMRWLVDFSRSRLPMEDILERWGWVPLPPYIQREPVPDDEGRYQTVYAAEPGSVAAPTAGLHFTPRVLDEIRGRGARIEYVTLHVGLGTFSPIKTGNIGEHRMHEEVFEVPGSVAEECGSARASGKRVVAVGTTTVRALESAARGFRGITPLFLQPGAEFRWVDAMVTNFHQPKSSLLVMLAAFAGRDLLLEAYQDAIREKYRFFSYGDSMLVI
ncbi:MAG: tRNA preQ1(34) S-adenosylmethionine ribosyltransferase-isomerase QueA [Bdellovibrionales bacterium]|nr:tRNA preQ1(34) S-adenosylmethionine ribosyltransferase-isomerase QueA [Bdellovibrionales bacterium]